AKTARAEDPRRPLSLTPARRLNLDSLAIVNSGNFGRPDASVRGSRCQGVGWLVSILKCDKTESPPMFLKTAIFFCILGSLTVAVAQTRVADFKNAGQSSAAAQAVSAAPAARPDEVAALRDDIRKMRNLVQQMETNLSFVSDTQSPLKHQF